jgi:lipopolysaccharide/colanic/teichoic acid biosynthesis glycosyltransferase
MVVECRKISLPAVPPTFPSVLRMSTTIEVQVDQRIRRQDALSSEPGALLDLSGRPRWYPACKAMLESVAALVLLVVSSPLMLVLAVVTRLTSAGSAFYSQTRLGKHGKPYTIYKIRTMTQNCERQSGACWSSANDSRVTPFGRWLRKTHLDELPQLWNVLRGDMSLIGPRPERPEFVPSLEKAIPHYRQRLLVKPGVTGLAQVQLPADVDLEDVRRKLAYDLYYVSEQNVSLDLRILACTALHMVGVPYHLLRRLFRMPCLERVQEAYGRFGTSSTPVPSLQPTNG